MSAVEGTAENTWVPPEGQHQGLHGPPTSPTPEQLGVRTTGSCLGLRGLALQINKRSPNPQGQGLRLSWGLENHFSSLSATLSRGRNNSSAGMGGAASLGWAKECHPLFSKRPEAAPGSWAADRGRSHTPYSGRSRDSFLLVGPATSQFCKLGHGRRKLLMHSRRWPQM